MSGLRRLWPNLAIQSEERDMPLVGGPAVSIRNPEVMKVAQRDEAVPLSELSGVSSQRDETRWLAM